VRILRDGRPTTWATSARDRGLARSGSGLLPRPDHGVGDGGQERKDDGGKGGQGFHGGSSGDGPARRPGAATSPMQGPATGRLCGRGDSPSPFSRSRTGRPWPPPVAGSALGGLYQVAATASRGNVRRRRPTPRRPPPALPPHPGRDRGRRTAGSRPGPSPRRVRSYRGPRSLVSRRSDTGGQRAQRLAAESPSPRRCGDGRQGRMSSTAIGGSCWPAITTGTCWPGL
jgi:hypothetical protein